MCSVLKLHIWNIKYILTYYSKIFKCLRGKHYEVWAEGSYDVKITKFIASIYFPSKEMQ